MTRSQFRTAILVALAGAMGLLRASPGMAAAVDILVLDPEGDPVPGVVVYAVGGTSQPPAGRPAVMDQINTRFVPHVLAIQKGTAVDFPNSDVVAHHVYSFSKPNDFVLPLYKGDPHQPVTFNHDGIVTLGCNIHDQMLAYIVVVDTDTFGITDDQGRLTLDFDPDVTAVSIWSPRIRDRDSALTRELAATDSAIVFQLQKKLPPAYDSGADAIQWTEY